MQVAQFCNVTRFAADAFRWNKNYCILFHVKMTPLQDTFLAKQFFITNNYRPVVLSKAFFW